MQMVQWAYKLPIRYPQLINLCYEELEGCMRDMIRERKDEKAGGAEHEDLFSALLSGVNDDEGDGILSTEELRTFLPRAALFETDERLEKVGNMYIFLLAGHETTAHTLAFALTLLALYPEHQDLLHDEAEGVMGGRVSSYDDYTSLVTPLLLPLS
jgi:cytochrome P450